MSYTQMTRRGFVTTAAAAATAGIAAETVSIASAEEARPEVAASWVGEEPSIGDDDCSETINTEILVIGAGCSGYFAAVTAAEEGARVELIDCSETGYSVRTSALGAVNSKMQLDQGVCIDKMEIVNDIVHYCNNNCDQRLWNMWANESGETLDWYCDHAEKPGTFGVYQEWNMPEGLRYKMWPTGHGTFSLDGDWGAAVGNITAYFNDYLNSFDGCEYRGYTKLQKLIVENGAVVGAYVSTGENQDGYARINASKGVVVATGGYVLNEDMMRALQPETVSIMSGIFTMSQAHGDGIKACIWAGAHIEDTHTSLIFDRGNITPDVEVGDPYNTNGSFIAFSSQPWLKVNVDGERFMNESCPYDYVAHAAIKFRNHAWYPVWDDKFDENVALFHTIGCSTQITREGGDEGSHIDPTMDPMERLLASEANVRANIENRVENGLVIKADTLEELAEGLGIDVDGFVATVARYNELCANNKDVDFGKEAWRMTPVATPPFYGMKMGGLALCTYDGICVNTNLQALDSEGAPIPGLYVIGNDSGNMYDTTYPNFAAGLNAGRCATQGRHVGKYLAAL